MKVTEWFRRKHQLADDMEESPRQWVKELDSAVELTAKGVESLTNILGDIIDRVDKLEQMVDITQTRSDPKATVTTTELFAIVNRLKALEIRWTSVHDLIGEVNKILSAAEKTALLEADKMGTPAKALESHLPDAGSESETRPTTADAQRSGSTEAVDDEQVIANAKASEGEHLDPKTGTVVPMEREMGQSMDERSAITGSTKANDGDENDLQSVTTSGTSGEENPEPHVVPSTDIEELDDQSNEQKVRVEHSNNELLTEIKSELQSLREDRAAKDQIIAELSKKVQEFEEASASALPEGSSGSTRQKIESINTKSVVNDPATKQQAAQAPSAPSLDLESLVADAIKRETEGYDADMADLLRYRDEAETWEKKTLSFASDLDEIVTFCAGENGLVNRAAGIHTSLPEEHRDRLKSQQAGLMIVGNMISRLTDFAKANGESPTQTGELVLCDKEKWTEILRTKSTHVEAEKLLAHKLRELGDERYRVVTGMRDLATRRRKGCLGICVDRVLRVIDGCEDGKKNSIPAVEAIKAATSEFNKNLSEWLDFHDDLRKRMLAIIAKVGVLPMEIEPGDPTDFTRCEPIGAEPWDGHLNETVKEVVRPGYLFAGSGEDLVVLRSAQVIVVKNLDNEKVATT